MRLKAIEYRFDMAEVDCYAKFDGVIKAHDDFSDDHHLMPNPEREAITDFKMDVIDLALTSHLRLSQVVIILQNADALASYDADRGYRLMRTCRSLCHRFNVVFHIDACVPDNASSPFFNF